MSCLPCRGKKITMNFIMKELKNQLKKELNQDFVLGVLSNPRKKEGRKKIKFRPVLKGKEFCIQAEEWIGNQVFHTNFSPQECLEFLVESIPDFRQLQWVSKTKEVQFQFSKKGKVGKKERRLTEERVVTYSHNRDKQYILQEGEKIPFLQDLGVMTREGKVVQGKRDKFRQINRFLEFVRDTLPAFSKEEPITILDFGCGKSYLSFALYYYLKELLSYSVEIIGLDLKADVMKHCNQLAQKYGYQGLRFLVGDIGSYQGHQKIDMMVCLHACDVATDLALAKAVEWEAKVILAVPCCQHQLHQQIKSEWLQPILKYGLLKERMAALLTDGIRAEYLEGFGYETQILEFIDMEHTPKNLLIRGIKKGKKRDTIKAVQELEEHLSLQPEIRKLLQK